MVKKALLALFLLACFSLVTAGAISVLTVDQEVALERPLTISGTYSADTNNYVLCAFKIFDDENILVVRLSDEYTFVDGTFSTEYKLTEPLFNRGSRYRVNVTCNTAGKDAYFNVGQKQGFFGITTDMVLNDYAWFTNSDNMLTVVLTFILVTVFIGMFYWVVWKGIFG